MKLGENLGGNWEENRWLRSLCFWRERGYCSTIDDLNEGQSSNHTLPNSGSLIRVPGRETAIFRDQREYMTRHI